MSEQMFVMGVRLDEEKPEYCYFSSAIDIGKKAVVEIDGNPYVGEVLTCHELTEGNNFESYWPILRPADEDDIAKDQDNKERDFALLRPIQEQADKLKLQMRVFRVYSSLDRNKVLIMYTSEERVDFRDLLHVLPPIVKARIEMRQVGPRDKAKAVGGLGICGLKLCCATFLTSFDGISIAMAKNQMLAINIPKLSGQCGKLICCLKFEDAAYSEARKEFPKVGTIIAYKGNTAKVTGMNMLSRTITVLTSGEDGQFVTIPLSEYNMIIHPELKPAPAPLPTLSNEGARRFDSSVPNASSASAGTNSSQGSYQNQAGGQNRSNNGNRSYSNQNNRGNNGNNNRNNGGQNNQRNNNSRNNNGHWNNNNGNGHNSYHNNNNRYNQNQNRGGNNNNRPANVGNNANKPSSPAAPSAPTSK